MSGINLIKENGCYMVCIIVDQKESVLCRIGKECEDHIGVFNGIVEKYLKVQDIKEPTPDVQKMLIKVMGNMPTYTCANCDAKTFCGNVPIEHDFPNCWNDGKMYSNEYYRDAFLDYKKRNNI